MASPLHWDPLIPREGQSCFIGDAPDWPVSAPDAPLGPRFLNGGLCRVKRLCFLQDSVWEARPDRRFYHLGQSVLEKQLPLVRENTLGKPHPLSQGSGNCVWGLVALGGL